MPSSAADWPVKAGSRPATAVGAATARQTLARSTYSPVSGAKRTTDCSPRAVYSCDACTAFGLVIGAAVGALAVAATIIASPSAMARLAIFPRPWQARGNMMAKSTAALSRTLGGRLRSLGSAVPSIESHGAVTKPVVVGTIPSVASAEGCLGPTPVQQAKGKRRWGKGWR